jgi:RNA polymerase sigma-70 factor (ECF subfamily)
MAPEPVSEATTDWADLVSRIARREPEAQVALYERFGPRIGFLAARTLRSASGADDVRSETLVRVLRAIVDGRVHTPAALPGFVLQVARNVIRERQREERRQYPLDEAPDPSVGPASASCDPAARRALRVAVGHLAPRDRAFLRMYFVEDLSRDEIARRLGIAEDRVRLVKSRAVQRFRTAYHSVVNSVVSGSGQ